MTAQGDETPCSDCSCTKQVFRCIAHTISSLWPTREEGSQSSPAVCLARSQPAMVPCAWTQLKLIATQQALQKQLREVRDRAGQREEHFEKELATAQKLAALYKSTADGRTSRCTELEGIVRELKEHVQARPTPKLHPLTALMSMSMLLCS